MSESVFNALDRLIAPLMQTDASGQPLLTAEYDSDLPSPCQVGAVDDNNHIHWQPVRQSPSGDFSNLEQALALPLHDDIKAYYSRYYCDQLDCLSERGELQMLQAWNADDFARLQQNLIGHVLMKRRLKQPMTLFIGVTDEEDFILSVDNASGEVLLERIGCLPQEILAPSVAEFLDCLTLVNMLPNQV